MKPKLLEYKFLITGSILGLVIGIILKMVIRLIWKISFTYLPADFLFFGVIAGYLLKLAKG